MGYSIDALGALSAAEKETRILQLKAFLNTTATNQLGIDKALASVGNPSWNVFIKYLAVIDQQFSDTLNATGCTNLVIIKREALYLRNLQAKRAR